MHSTIRFGLAVASLVALGVGCTVGASGEDAAVQSEKVESAAAACDAVHGSRPPASPSSTSSDPTFKFYLVSLGHNGGYAAAELGEPYSICADGYASSVCHQDDLDFTLLNMAKPDLAAIRAQFVSDPGASTLVVMGASTRSYFPGKGMLTILRVKELWRAPAAGSVRASDSWYHVSHTPMQALEINHWNKPRATSLDLKSAPWFSECDADDAGVVGCVPSQGGVLEDAATETGILVDGTLSRNGTLHVTQYMAKITVGQLHEDNGYWYCHPDQLQCSDGFCSNTDNCVGLHFHGPILKTIYTRSQAQEVQPWLIQTTQLTAAESADLMSRAQH